MQVLSRSHMRMAVWERGAGQTLACGTGACATVVAGVLEGRTERSCQYVPVIIDIACVCIGTCLAGLHSLQCYF